MSRRIFMETLLAVQSVPMGQFHATENIADKLRAVSLSLDQLLFHVSRPMRWDISMISGAAAAAMESP